MDDRLQTRPQAADYRLLASVLVITLVLAIAIVLAIISISASVLIHMVEY